MKERKVTIFTLVCGTEYSARSLAEECDICQTSARYRLNKAVKLGYTAEWVKRGKKEYRTTAVNKKLYKLSDGKSLTANEVAERFNISLSTMRCRLSHGIRDVEKLGIKPVQGRRLRESSYQSPVSSSNEVQQRIAERNANNPLDRLWMSMKSA